MARIRTYKPEFFKSEDVAALPFRARLTWLGLWAHCDNYGRAKDNTKLIKADVWPLDPVSLKEIEDDLTLLADHGRIVRYEVDGRRYLAVVNWDRHQPVARPGVPKHPAPPVEIANVARHENDGALRSTLSTGEPVDNNGQLRPKRASDATLQRSDTTLPIRGQGTGIRGGDARASASMSAGNVPGSPEPPPRTCSKHPGGTEANCGPCKSARLNYERWESDQARAAAERDRERRKQPPCDRCGTRHRPGTCPATDTTEDTGPALMRGVES